MCLLCLIWTSAQRHQLDKLVITTDLFPLLFLYDRPRSSPPNPILLVVDLIRLIATISFFGFPFSNSSPPKHSVSNSNMGIVHVVMFEFKEEATAEEIADVRYPNPNKLRYLSRSFE